MHSTIVTALIVATALFMENMDGTVLATSLPAIAKDMGQDPIVLKLALTSYMLTLAVFIPASGWVADKLGARTVFSAAIVVFTLGSIACGASVSLPTLIAARVFQGLGGAMMVPVGRLVLLRSVPKTEIVSAMAYLTIPALIGPVVGPPLGGFITTYFHWRWIFWINVPIGMLGLGLTLKLIENVRERDVGPFDFKGFVLSGVGLLSFVFGLTIIGRRRHPGLAGGGADRVGGGDARRLCRPRPTRRATRSSTCRCSNCRPLPPASSAACSSASASAPCRSCCRLLLQLGFGLSPFESGSLTFAAAAGRDGHESVGELLPQAFRL